MIALLGRDFTYRSEELRGRRVWIGQRELQQIRRPRAQNKSTLGDQDVDAKMSRRRKRNDTSASFEVNVTNLESESALHYVEKESVYVTVT